MKERDGNVSMSLFVFESRDKTNIQCTMLTTYRGANVVRSVVDVIKVTTAVAYGRK